MSALSGRVTFDIDAPARLAGMVGDRAVPEPVVVGEDEEPGSGAKAGTEQPNLDHLALNAIAGDVFADGDRVDPGEHDAGRDIAESVLERQRDREGTRTDDREDRGRGDAHEAQRRDHGRDQDRVARGLCKERRDGGHKAVSDARQPAANGGVGETGENPAHGQREDRTQNGQQELRPSGGICERKGLVHG